MNLCSTSFEPWAVLDSRLAFARHHPVDHVEMCPNRNPQLAWSNVPDGTKSFALLCYDDDVPTVGDDVNQEGRSVDRWLERARFYHWALADLGRDLREIAEGSHSDGITPGGKGADAGPDGGVAGINDYTSWFAGDEAMKGDYHGYDGPCPPWNDERTHAYIFALLALDVASLGLQPGFTGGELEAAAQGHVLARAELGGLYRINPA